MERFFHKQLGTELLVIAGIGLVLGMLGPFGTYAMPTALRLIYWVTFIVIGYVIFRPISFVASWLSEASPIGFPVAIGLAIAVAALPLSVMIGFMINGFSLEGPMLSDGFALLYVQVAGIGLGIFLLMQALFRSDSDDQDRLPETVDETAKTPALLKRLPPGFQTQILALGVEDHYVRVHGPDHSEMLLIRLGDAIREMDGVAGIQVHRSWWVAQTAIRTTKRDGRNLRLVLQNGMEVPVSRTSVAKLKQSGWI